MKDKKVFGLFIKQKRQEKNYSQKELAELLFVTESAVSKWERGITYPDITLITDICKVLEITEHELIESCNDNEYRKIKNEAAKYNKFKKISFWILNILYLIGLVTCFIVNLAVEHTLSWFFIVALSLICSYTFCPTITPYFSKYKLIIFSGSTFCSMFLLFLGCSIYTSNYWFMIPTLGVLLAYFIIFFPILFKKQKKYLDSVKYEKLFKSFLLDYVMGMFLIMCLLLVFINIYSPFNIMLGFLITGGIYMIPIVLGILNILEVDKLVNKVICITATSIVVVFLLICIVSSMHLMTKVTMKTYLIEENYRNIKIGSDNCNINIYLSNNAENKIEYLENSKVLIEIKIEDDTLIINQKDQRKLYEKIFDFKTFEVNLFLSNDLINTLNIDNSTGNININEGFIINETDIKTSTGNIMVENCSIKGSSNIETKTGNTRVSNLEISNLNIKASTGDIKLSNVFVKEDLNIKTSTGNIKFDSIDASNIYMETRTGNVQGTVLTNKIFIAISNTGNISVPETTSGGVCKIITSTGNIKVNYK